jgi:hypothetical protein
MAVGTDAAIGMHIGAMPTGAAATSMRITAVALRTAMVDSMADRASAVANLMAAVSMVKVVSTVEVASTAADAGKPAE